MDETSFDVEITEDAAAFLAAAADHLAADPVLTTVVSTNAARVAAAADRGVEPPTHPQWFALVRDHRDEVVGLAMRTAPFEPHPLFVLPMADGAARALARAVHERGEKVRGANGALPAAEVLLAELGELQGGVVRVDEHTRLFELGDLVEPPLPEGRLRLASPADGDVVLTWFNAFGADAAEQAGRADETPAFHTPEDIAHRIDDGRVWLWEDEAGTTVHVTGHSLPAYGVSRVGPVYTPREHRGRGYASATVACVSRRMHDEGVRVCLFTDQANPTSNGIYLALGFRPVVDMANLLLD